MMLQCDILRNVEPKGRLPHARPGGDNYKVATLQPGSHAIEIEEAGRNARDELMSFGGYLPDVFELLFGNFADGHESFPDAVFGDGEDQALSLIENGIRFVFRVEAGRT